MRGYEGSLTEEERERNRLGSNLLYFHTQHALKKQCDKKVGRVGQREVGI
jgi:hypothetical protein